MTEKNTKEGKVLATILVPTSGNYPVRGVDGYGGEQDGTNVEYLGVYQIPSRKVAEKITIGKKVGIHWAHYIRGTGWRISLAYWSDSDARDVWIALDAETKCKCKIECIG